MANGSFFAAGSGAAGVRAITAGADTTVLRYGDTYAGFFVPRTVFTAESCVGVGVGGLILATIRAGVGILLGLARGERTCCGTGGSPVEEAIVGSFCSKDFLRGVVSWMVYVTGSSSTSGSSGERTRSRDIGAGDCRVSGEKATGVAMMVARAGGVRGLSGSIVGPW